MYNFSPYWLALLAGAVAAFVWALWPRFLAWRYRDKCKAQVFVAVNRTTSTAAEIEARLAQGGCHLSPLLVGIYLQELAHEGLINRGFSRLRGEVWWMPLTLPVAE